MPISPWRTPASRYPPDGASRVSRSGGMRRWRRDQEHRMTHDQEFWEERYRSVAAVWSKRPNAALVAQAADLAPALALDVGCGEGAAAFWLAERGWRVTAVDWAPAALQRGADAAASRGEDVAG